MVRLSGLFIVCLCLLVSGCFHSTGSKTLTVDPRYGSSLQPQKIIYVAVVGSVPEGCEESPEYIATQFAKNILPVAKEVDPGSLVADFGAGLEKARERNAEYLILLQVRDWRYSSIFSPGQKASLGVTVFDVASGTTLHASDIDASCLVMLVGLEQSPRECIRPQVDMWIQQTFQVEVPDRPYGDVKTFGTVSPK